MDTTWDSDVRLSIFEETKSSQLIHTSCVKINIAIEVEGSSAPLELQGVDHRVLQEVRSELVVSYLTRSSMTLPGMQRRTTHSLEVEGHSQKVVPMLDQPNLCPFLPLSS
jgi:hypothetical protein